jgi:hypothetical protein
MGPVSVALYPDEMRAHFASMPIVSGDDLILINNRLANESMSV